MKGLSDMIWFQTIVRSHHELWRVLTNFYTASRKWPRQQAKAENQTKKLKKEAEKEGKKSKEEIDDIKVVPLTTDHLSARPVKVGPLSWFSLLDPI